MRYLKNYIALFCLFVVVSCSNDEQCRKDRFVKMQLGIYHVTVNNTTQTRTAALLSIDSIKIKGINVDSIIKTKGNTITLPLNKFSDESTYQITFNNVTDTLTIKHTNFDTYLSLECGCIKTFTIDNVLSTNHFLDSIGIVIHDVNTSTSAKEHIKLYN
jgi:hypothetical protein